ncbi:MAG: stage V sporulation protein AC [Oscillospiraceae bacterium]|nr:stage V sporulation protein AC [Oscillospiraceae bacterium]
MNNMTNEQYKQYIDSISPKSPWKRNMFRAFWVGGVICMIGQLVLNFWSAQGLDEQSAANAECITMIGLGVLLTGLGIYDKIANYAGAGTLVPITGFANAVASPAIEFKAEGFITGTAAKMFIIAGPVIVYGVSASVVYGLIYWVTSLF